MSAPVTKNTRKVWACHVTQTAIPLQEYDRPSRCLTFSRIILNPFVENRIPCRLVKWRLIGLKMIGRAGVFQRHPCHGYIDIHLSDQGIHTVELAVGAQKRDELDRNIAPIQVAVEVK